MSIEIHCLNDNKILRGWRDVGYEPVNFDNYNKKDLEITGIQVCWYWYGRGSYEGSGYLLFRTHTNKWGLHYCGHCSCYGPVDSDRISLRDTNETLSALIERCSGETKEEASVLFEAAMKWCRGKGGITHAGKIKGE